MVVTAISGPHVVYGITTGSTGNISQYNEERGPSVFDLGQSAQDPRNQYFGYDPGSAVGTQVKCFWDQQGIVDYIPFAMSSALVVSSAATPVAGTALTLTPISSLGAFNTTIIAPETGRATSVIAIDSTAATLNFGQAGTIATWNPAAGTGRAVAIITSCAATEGYYVRGRDMYGFKMTELISGSTTSSGSGQGRKAFKYIVSITPSSSSTFTSTGVSVGMADIFGLPLYAPYMAGISVWASTTPNAAGTITISSANSLIASTAVTATATTADVRGTIGGAGLTAPIATNGTSANGAGGFNPTSTGARYTMYQQITPNMAAQISGVANSSAWFGVTQFSDF